MHTCALVKWLSELLVDLKLVGSILTGEIFDTEIHQRPLKGWWFDPWQDDFNYFIIAIYK
jgi:hypothetical protein